MNTAAQQPRENPRVPGAPARAEFIALIAALMGLNALAIDVMLPALPYMGEALSVVNENDRQLVLSFYMLGFGLTQIVFGPLSDRFGRRSPLLIGLVVYALAAFLAVFSPNFTTLLALRMAQGMGAAGTRVIAQSIVRDRYQGRAMAEVMSLVFMVFMVVPVIAPAIGQLLLLTGPWWTIFLFMSALSLLIGLWTFVRLPETLDPGNRRPLTLGAITDGFRIVFTNRLAMFYSLANMFIFGALMGFINSAQQIFVDIYALGPYFPVIFAMLGTMMAVSSYLNSRIVRRFGVRRVSHFALTVFIVFSGLWLLTSLSGPMSMWVFLGFFGVVSFMFGWTAANMNSLSMEPLGAVAGTASSVFGFTQTIGGALIGLVIGRAFNGTIMPLATGYFVAGLIAIGAVLVAEKGHLFGTSMPAPSASGS
ncbi:MAG TPA: Bcr/CflA family efflux MFS transporter [Devosia sp.]|nr:Bcr/CflA family efflux MFS transporter [Devosia sp.]